MDNIRPSKGFSACSRDAMKLTADDIAYLKDQATARGHDPNNLLKVMNYESSGDPSRWGGKGGNYFGLIQFGPTERKQFGVDTENPSARNQIDATFKFLASRGYKPGMGLLDLYSTINAGSPGHYNASDGNGTVASHVANMLGQPVDIRPSAQSGLLGGSPINVEFNSAPTEEAQAEAQPSAIAALGNLFQQHSQPKVGGLLNAPQEQEDELAAKAREFAQQMAEHHQALHASGLRRAGLLGA